MTRHREPYVGEGADGCRRSAQVDLAEADTLDELNPRRELLAMSAHAWELEAELLDAEVRAAGRHADLADLAVEDGVSMFDGLPFCIVRATSDAGDVMVGQLRPAEVRRMALQWLEAAEAAESDAAVAAMLRDGNPDLAAGDVDGVIGSALTFLRGRRLAQAAAAERADGTKP